MARAGFRRSERRAPFSALALIALIFQLAVPPGFMVGATAGGPSIVICTGHGALLAPSDQPGAPAKAPPGKAAPTCPFAGHGGTPLTPASLSVVAVRFVSYSAPSLGFNATFPGRGLAAPPPPSQAPPAHFV